MAAERSRAGRGDRASREPLQILASAVDNEAHYFVDMAVTRRNGVSGGRRTGIRRPLHDARLEQQRAALAPCGQGWAREELLPASRKAANAAASRFSVDPRSGETCMVGARS